MKSIFFKLYSSLIIMVIFVSLLAYVALGYINQSRYETYLIQNVGGTFALMTAGIVRHEGKKRQQWIDVVERLTGISLEISLLKNPEDYNLYRLKKDNQPVYIQSDSGKQTAKIALPLPGKDDLYVLSELTDINQTVARMTALLILNELGRHPKEQRTELLASLDQNFDYNLALESPEQFKLDKSQLRQLLRGDIVINLNDTVSSTPFIKVYARFGNSGQFLTLGPINIFQWYPVSLIFLLVALGALVVLVSGYILVFPFEKKLKTLEEGINRAGTADSSSIKLAGNDGISRMATSVNAMTQRIESLIAQQQQLTHDISHELRTPVARMMFRVEGMSAGIEEDQAEPLHITGMKKDLSSLNRMIDEILTCARLDHSQSLETGQFDMIAVVTEMLDELSLQHPDIQFHRVIDIQQLLLRADETLLRRAIQNILLNACRHCLSTVSVYLAESKGTLYVSIEDDGTGIPEVDRKRIFDPFIRLDESRNRALGGFGLGLPIVQKVATAHGGNIIVDTSHTLGGALFCLSLPLPQSNSEENRDVD